MTDDRTPANDSTEAAVAADEIGGGSLDTLTAEVAALRDQMLRYAADAENTKRRAEREMNDARAYAIQRFAKDLLGAADNLENALKVSPRDDSNPAVQKFVEGVELTEKNLQAAFERNGLKKIDPTQGERFDPHLHQAVMEQAQAGADAGTVLQTLQPGYELYGRLVRPAMVIVAAKAPASAAPQANGQDAHAANPYAQADDEADAGGSVDTKA
jgi:molecular chaperone GrpE